MSLTYVHVNTTMFTWMISHRQDVRMPDNRWIFSSNTVYQTLCKYTYLPCFSRNIRKSCGWPIFFSRSFFYYFTTSSVYLSRQGLTATDNCFTPRPSTFLFFCAWKLINVREAIVERTMHGFSHESEAARPTKHGNIFIHSDANAKIWQPTSSPQFWYLLNLLTTKFTVQHLTSSAPTKQTQILPNFAKHSLQNPFIFIFRPRWHVPLRTRKHRSQPSFRRWLFITYHALSQYTTRS